MQYGTRGELSRWDHVSVICSSCATHEAMLLVKDRRSLHPITGRRPWYRKPAAVSEGNGHLTPTEHSVAPGQVLSGGALPTCGQEA